MSYSSKFEKRKQKSGSRRNPARERAVNNFNSRSSIFTLLSAFVNPSNTIHNSIEQHSLERSRSYSWRKKKKREEKKFDRIISLGQYRSPTFPNRADEFSSFRSLPIFLCDARRCVERST